MGIGEEGIVIMIIQHGGRQRTFQGISEEDVQMKIDGYLKRCDYRGERGFISDSHNGMTIII